MTEAEFQAAVTPDLADAQEAIERLTTAYFNGQVTEGELRRYGDLLGIAWWYAMGLPTTAELRRHVRDTAS
jgi:hypothetical protein